VASTIIGPGLGDICFIIGVDELGAGLATVLSYQYILIAQVLNVLILHDYRGYIAIYLTPIALIGMYLAVSDVKRVTSIRGVLASYVAAVAWAVSAIIVSYLVNNRGLLPVAVAGLRTVFLAPLLMCLGVKSIRTVSKRALVVLASSGIISYFIGFILFTTSLKELGITVPTLATALTSALSQVISSIALSEALTLKSIIGSSIIIASLIATALAMT